MRAVASSAVNTKFLISTAGVLCYSHSACFLRSLVAYFQLWYGLLMSFLHDRLSCFRQESGHVVGNTDLAFCRNMQ